MVVSPQVSLTKDQVCSVKEKDVAAVYIGDCSDEEYCRRWCKKDFVPRDIFKPADPRVTLGTF